MQGLHPSLAEYLLLEQPWPAALVLLTVAVTLFGVGGRRRQGRLQLAGLGVALLAGGVVVLAWGVTTPRERVAALTDELLRATEGSVDDAALRRLLAPGATLVGPDGDDWLAGEALHGAVRGAAERFGPVEHEVRQRTVSARGGRGGRGIAEIDLRTRINRGGAAGVPVSTRWTLHWRLDGGGGNGGGGSRGGGVWRVERVVWQAMQNRPPEPGWLR
ncbi:MAG: DUF4440 domain-containing protein [Phycisphaeraceae bacterium]